MDCHLSQLLLAFRRHELAAADAVALDAHLSRCPACAAAARREAAFDAVVSRAMTAVPVPTGLHDRLVRSADGKLSADRWRTVGRRAGVTAIAALAVAVGVGGYDQLTRPTVSSGRLAAEWEQEADFPDQKLAEWMKGQGLPASLPAPFDYRHVIEYGRKPVAGREVPVVLFQNRRHGPDVCRVYVLPDRRFRFGSLDDFTGSQVTVKAVRAGGVVYVFAYTGDSLAPFLRRQEPPQ